MKVVFLSRLHVEKLEDDRWMTLAPFVVSADDEVLTVPVDFELDFASVPRLPLAYLLAGNTAHKSATVHDFLYQTGAGRKYADEVFLAAMRAEGVAWWRRALMYTAVRLFGGRAYREKAIAQGSN